MLKEILDIVNINYLLGLFVFIWLFRNVIKDIRVTRRIKTFPNYMGVLEFHMEKAFEMIYKDRVFIYSLEATRPSEEEIDKASKDFVILVQKLLGPAMQQEFIDMYGGTDAFTFIMLEWFHRKFEDDEIRRSAVESYMNQDEEITP
jgi:hypothetical protein